MIEDEAMVFLRNHRGPEVVPRKFVTKKEGLVIVEAVSPGYDCALLEGVFEGILKICQAQKGSVSQTKCVAKGDAVCQYRIKWEKNLP